MRRALITGIPGTGKSEIGRHLEAAHGFRHLDMEAALKRLNEGRSLVLEIFTGWEQHDSVISWGFHPFYDVAAIRTLAMLGFKLFWFDGDRQAALRAFNRRGDVKEEMFHLQIHNIGVARIMDQFKDVAIALNPFDGRAEFRKQEEIALEILGQLPK